MEEEKTIDEKRFSLTWKTGLAVTAFLLVFTNTGTLQISEIDHNAEENARLELEFKEDLEDVEAAGRRRLENGLEINRLEQRIIFLEYQLDVCKSK